jgi:hypothetical protein
MNRRNLARYCQRKTREKKRARRMILLRVMEWKRHCSMMPPLSCILVTSRKGNVPLESVAVELDCGANKLRLALAWAQTSRMRNLSAR